MKSDDNNENEHDLFNISLDGDDIFSPEDHLSLANSSSTVKKSVSKSGRLSLGSVASSVGISSFTI